MAANLKLSLQTLRNWIANPTLIAINQWTRSFWDRKLLSSNIIGRKQFKDNEEIPIGDRSHGPRSC